jgi:hypothetical protein
MRTTTALIVTAGVAALAGCASAAGAVPAARPSADVTVAGYRLYTHCGIGDARINGRWYRASPPLSDGAGNPPAGWGNPYQLGTMRLTSERVAVFSDAAGHHVRFILRPGATAPTQVCS